ncbi:MAG: hypothetical protein CMM07_16200 [Rhodopirellula sp.]|nr:hypothetical protein [Rhodopirellula sp.]
MLDAIGGPVVGDVVFMRADAVHALQVTQWNLVQGSMEFFEFGPPCHFTAFWFRAGCLLIKG